MLQKLLTTNFQITIISNCDCVAKGARDLKGVNMSTREVPIVVITGYLGSGKTTLMQNILRQEKRKIALIVNDMGSINIDASILNKTGNQLAQIEMVEMQNGCICCTLRVEFMAEIERLSADMSIEAIFVEASGISEPSSIAGAFLNYEAMKEDTRVCS